VLRLAWLWLTKALLAWGRFLQHKQTLFGFAADSPAADFRLGLEGTMRP